MIKLGITGGIGAGKSIVSRLFRLMGVPVYDSDSRAKRLTVTHTEIRKELVELLSDQVYLDGELNKAFLAECLFKDGTLGKQINGIIHPRVKEDFRRWAKLHNSFPVVALESAILIESGFTDQVDKLLLVYAPLETRVFRTMQRDNISEELVLQRIRKQDDDDLKRKAADFIIYNYDAHSVIRQVEQVLLQLSES